MRRCDAATNDRLTEILARCGVAGDFTSSDALAAVAGFARHACRRGLALTELPTAVRRSLTEAVPAAMSTAAFETIARQLVRHAAYALIDD